jgi:hypothetical protein
MKQKKSLFSEIYKLDEKTNSYMIEIALDRYADIFNEWDPAPFKRRDIDPDLQVYLEESSNEIPFRFPIELCFTIAAEVIDGRLDKEALDGFRNSFGFKLYFLKKEIRKTNIRMLEFVLIGFVFLWIAAFLSLRYTEEQIIPHTLIQGLFIAGWFFIGEAVSLIFFTNRDLYHRYRTHRRLQNALIIFKATGQASPSATTHANDALMH